MEDHRKSETDSTNHGDEKIVELTQEMALSDQNDGNIIDLTKSVDSLDAPPVETKPEPEKTAPEKPVEQAPPPPIMEKDPPRIIEEEVDAAFEAVQVPESQEVTNDDEEDVELFDRLSGITELVDDAVRQKEPSQTIETEDPVEPATEPELTNEENLAADAAVFEAAMEVESTEEEILELTDVVDLENQEVASDPLDEDDLIELTDIVDPTELAQSDGSEAGEEEILELTDIVDSAQFDTPVEEEEDILVLTDIVSPSEIKVTEEENLTDAMDGIQAQESSLADPEMEDSDGSETAQESERQKSAEVETDEIADLFIEEMAPDELAMEDNDILTTEQIISTPSEMESPAEEQEQVIQLSDVLGQPEREDHVPIEEIKMGAEEDLAVQPISLESEDTANALGLDLDMPAAEEDPLRDQKIEAAVEHILQTKYADTIDRLIANAVEKAVKQEMESIKRSLADDDTKP